MVNIYIDGEKIEAQAGETIISAAVRNGIDIPHFCWHPELSLGGNCRMCLVETGNPKRNPDGSYVKDENDNLYIDYLPKLQIACNTVVADGMHIRTKSDKVIKAQESVLEFILINHPLDCPICDEAGQCKLQEYTYRYSNGISRFEEQKNKNPKRIEWNDKIIYDAERCISCGRCIRFTKEIAGEDILTFVNRGDKVRVDRFDDKKIQNSYSMNIIDNCPVGALTSKDFRFKARVWEMSFNNTICPGCSRGCNIRVGVKNNRVLRIEPYQNKYVNKNWMCDDGRISQYDFINNNRLDKVKIRKDSGFVNTDLETAISYVQSSLKVYDADQVLFLASSMASLETNYLLQKLATNIFKTKNIAYLNRLDEKFGDDFLKTKDRGPNINGLKALGINNITADELISKIHSKKIRAIYILDEDFIYYNEIIPVLQDLDFLVIHSSNNNEALQYSNVVFPVATFAEQEGIFVNCEDRAQYFKPVIRTAFNFSKYAILNQSRLDKFESYNDKWSTKENNINIKPSWYILSVLCHNNNYRTVEDIFNEICQTNELFKNFSYELLIKHSGLNLGNKEPDSEPIQRVYIQNNLR